MSNIDKSRILRCLTRKAISSVCAVLALVSNAFAFGSNPTPYDSESYNPAPLAPRSTSGYFILDAVLPYEYQSALDDRKFIGVTGIYLGGHANGRSNESTTISVNDTAVMQDTKTACSIYSGDVCYNISHFYQPHIPQLGLVGLLALDGATMIQWGLNTGYNAQKITVSPSIMLGLAKRFYFSDARDRHIIFEASTWLGGSVNHRPCIDDFDRLYYCGNLSSWKEFNYDAHPQSNFFKITYESLF